tara:strand:- start:3661 stop:3924 length:264 start_codon:yes stop_codon:yes gene_type:complete
MEEIMLVEGIGKITIVNGLLRVGITSVGSDGEVKEIGDLQIPANSIEGVINALVTGVNDINTQILEQQSKSNGNGDGKKEEKKDKKK